ncbi:MAG: DNA methyltransferase [Bacteriovorax sp.]
MNAVEIEEAVSKLAEQPFDAENFPFLFLEAFGNKATTIQRLRSGASNKSDVEGGVLQHNNIHIAISKGGDVTNTLIKLRESSATIRQKAKFILATDGKEFQAEDLSSDTAPIVCEYKDFPDHFGFFLPLAGISTVKQIRESSFDIKATGRLNRLYVELLKDNPKWGSAERRHDMNHFMARLIFCFFAEDTNIFNQEGLFSKTIEQMSEKDSSNTHEIIEEVFRAMNTDYKERKKAKLPRWVEDFPYVNGGLFSGKTEVPKFSKIARSYLLHIGNLEWKKINPDIFGSMIQAVTEDEERGALGMHYTSVPNILRVLNPLFLDDLREQLEKAGNNARMLLNLRKRISKIRIFDPACGSGNFLVIAYKEMRAIEAEINRRRGEPNSQTEIQLTNFRGIELRDFPAEVARLALIIAEYQCNVLYIGQMLALQEFLPLEAENWIVNNNALQVDWFKVCPISESEERIETYLCGNPPYKGSQWQSSKQKEDLEKVFSQRTKKWKSLDYVSGWFLKASEYNKRAFSTAAFVSTNSVCQGRQVDTLWSLIFEDKNVIQFAHTSFKWSNLASHNAGVTVIIVGFSTSSSTSKRLFSEAENGESVVKVTENINAYLVSGANVVISQRSQPMSELSEMNFGNMPNDGGYLLLNNSEAKIAIKEFGVEPKYIRSFVGSQEFIKGVDRKCIWIEHDEYKVASHNQWLEEKFKAVKKQRLESDRETTRELANIPYRFGEVRQSGAERIIVVPSITSENRDYLPCGLLPVGTIVSNKNFALFDAPIWNLAIIASRLHWVWIGTVCVRMRTDFSYSNTLGWNTFPMPKMTERNKVELAKCAEEILLAREAHFPSTISDLYNPEKMPEDLRRAHERNDEVLERIYIGRRFKNDSERLEKLFELYTKMVSLSETIQKEKKKKSKEDKK